MRPYLSVVVPAYNEETRISPMLRAALHYLDSRNLTFELLVVNDGSTDQTADVVRTLAQRYPLVRLIDLAKNQGKGAAVKAGVLAATGEYILFSDADGSTPIEEVCSLEEALQAGAEIAIGSRAIPRKGVKVETVLHRRLLGRIFNAAVGALLLPSFYDTQCGFKLFTHKAAHDLFTLQRSTGFSFDCEILWLAQKRGYRVKEIGVNWNNVAGSKVNLIVDSLGMLRDLIKFRVWHRDVERMP